MAAERSTAAPKVAAGCLLYQIIEDEGTAGGVEKIQILEDTLSFMKQSVDEDRIMKEHAQKESRGKADGFKVGDIVEGNYFMEGTFYSGVVVEVSSDGNSVVVQYDDDGSTESLTCDNVRSLEPASEILAAQTARLSVAQVQTCVSKIQMGRGHSNVSENCLWKHVNEQAADLFFLIFEGSAVWSKSFSSQLYCAQQSG